VDLGFQDAPSSARFLGVRSSWDYNVVTAPGEAAACLSPPASHLFNIYEQDKDEDMKPMKH